jgi:hypothetical protein
MLRLIKYGCERLYTFTDSFFRGEEIRLSDHAGMPAIAGKHVVIRMDQYEWELKQDFGDIAARDAEALFRKFTPHFLRKYLAILNQWIILFFMIDDEMRTHNTEYQYNKSNQLTKIFTIYLTSRPDPRVIKCCKVFVHCFNRVICSSSAFVRNIKRHFHRITPSVIAEPFVNSPAGLKIRGPGSPKLISYFCFHKRN